MVGPFEKIGVRSDTEKTISEGEIVFIIYKGKFVGISVGNEVAGNLRSKSQFWVSPSKVFKGCASIGPCILSMEDEEQNNKPLELKLDINQYRDGEKIASGSIITEFKKSPVDIVKSTFDKASLNSFACARRRAGLARRRVRPLPAAHTVGDPRPAVARTGASFM